MNVERILSDIKGRMMEDIVLLETKIANPKKQVFQLQFAVGEFDMVVADNANATCEIYEVKHSKEQAKEQYRHLIDEEKLKNTEFRYGKITKRTVIYRGENATLENGIEYRNVEEDLDPTSIKKRFLWAFTSVRNKNEKVEDSTTVITVRCSKDGCKFNVETEKFSFDFVIINPDETCRIRRNGENQYIRNKQY